MGPSTRSITRSPETTTRSPRSDALEQRARYLLAAAHDLARVREPSSFGVREWIKHEHLPRVLVQQPDGTFADTTRSDDSDRHDDLLTQRRMTRSSDPRGRTKPGSAGSAVEYFPLQGSQGADRARIGRQEASVSRPCCAKQEVTDRHASSAHSADSAMPANRTNRTHLPMSGNPCVVTSRA